MLFPSGGNYLTGAFNVSSHSIVVIEAGATVTGSLRGEDYPLVDPILGPHPYSGSMPHPLIYTSGETNVSLTGGGTVDGLDQPRGTQAGQAIGLVQLVIARTQLLGNGVGVRL